MKFFLKCFVLTFCLAAGGVLADDSLLLSSFMSGYPNNMQYGTIYSDHAKLCICGLNTEILGDLGRYHEMYRLAQSAWNWKDATDKKKMNNWSNIAVNNAFIGGAMWYSPGDASFVTYVLPAKMMKAVIDAWVEIVAQGEIEATAGDCTPYISYFAANWYEVMFKNTKTEEDRAAFASSHFVDKFWEYKDNKGKFKMAYPEDFTAIKKNWLKGAEAKKSPEWLEVKQFPRVNAIVCEVSAKRKNQQGDLVDKPGNIIYSDYLTGYKMIVHNGKPLKYENGYEAANKLEIIGEKTALSKMMMISNRAFMWEEDLKTTDLADSAAVIENLVMPNTFEFQICTNILNPKSYGNFFEVSTTEWDKIWEYYKWNCPMIAFRGPLGYWVPDPEAGKKWLHRIPMIDKDKENLFPMEPVSDKIYNNMKDYSIDPGKVAYAKSDAYDGILEAAKKGEEENDEAQKADEENMKENESESVESEIEDQPKPTSDEINQAIEDAKKQFDSEASGEEGSKKEDDSEGSEDSSDKSYEEVVELPEPIVIKIKTCEERRKEIEELFQDKVPKNEKEAAMMVNLMMSHPHIHSCREMSKFQFNFADNGGSVLNIEPEAVVLHWRVKRVNPFKYDPKQKDPNKVVFEVIFYNHNYEDQKDALYYIPAREVVNEWDKFPGILVDFESFVIDRMGDVLTVPMAYDKFKRSITTEFKESGIGWSINDTASGPHDLAGNSSAYEFQMVFDDPNANYILHFFRIDSGTKRGFYDFIFQCWRIGEKYLMIKINGTQFNYSVLVNIYSNEEKLNEIWHGIYREMFDQYMSGGSGIVSLREIKHIVFIYMAHLAAYKYKFGFELNQIPIPGDEYDDPIGGHENMMTSDHTNFLFNYLATDVDITVIVRGFVHYRENISVLNLYFSTKLFESEYIIPLDNYAVFMGYIESIFNECYNHMYMLLKQVSIVESEDTTEEELDAEQKLGRYSMKKLLLKLVVMLTDRVVYGCVDQFSIPASEMAYNEDGTPAVMTSLDDLDDGDADKRVYKWTVTSPDNTGELLIRRSNRLYENIGVSRCSPQEKLNPVLLHLYPTRLDDRNGYALTINNPSLDGSKDIKTTYHFVKYQDYAHMRVFEDFITKIMNQMFYKRVPEEKKEGEGE